MALMLYVLQDLGMSDLDFIERHHWIVGHMFDVVQAFLNPELTGDKVHIVLPPLWKEYCEERGLEYDPTDLIQLLRAQYGQVDAAKRWMDMFVAIITDKSFEYKMTRCKTDPCILYRRSKEDELEAIVVIYVDDGYIGGKPKIVRAILDHLKKTVKILEPGRIDKHLGVRYKLKQDEHGWFYECSMQDYIEDAVEDYEAHIKQEMKHYETPGAPGKILRKHEGNLQEHPVKSRNTGNLHLRTPYTADVLESRKGLCTNTKSILGPA